MEAWTTTLGGGDDWTRLGSTPEKGPVEVIVRAFDGPVLVATGATPARPDAAPVEVPPGEGRRVTGLHVFAKASPVCPSCRILVRGVDPAPAAAR
jgi:hypothetical protein